MPQFLVDSNLPQTLNLWRTPEFVYARELELERNDTAIWRYAGEHGLIILSKDKDFADRILQGESDTPKVIHFRTGNMRFSEFKLLMTREWDRIKLYSLNFKLVLVYSHSLEGIK